METLLAIDGGGTKTEVLLATTSGKVLAKKVYDGTNLNSVGIEKAFGTLETALMDFSGIALENGMTLAGIYFGLAGGVNGNHQELVYSYFKNKYFRDIPFSNAGDDLNSINVGVKNAPNGIAVIAGTGSNVMLKKDGVVLPNPQLSGWGYLFDNGASGFDFGRDAVLAAKAEYNGTGKPTLITQMLETKLKSSVFDSLEEIYQKGPRFVAGLAPIVFDAYRAGDRVAGEIILKQIMNVANMINTGHEIIGKENDAKVGLVGGIFAHEKTIFEPNLKKMISPKLSIEFPKESQIYGALMEAAKNAGVYANDEFLKNFNQTYGAPVLDTPASQKE